MRGLGVARLAVGRVRSITPKWGSGGGASLRLGSIRPRERHASTVIFRTRPVRDPLLKRRLRGDHFWWAGENYGGEAAIVCAALWLTDPSAVAHSGIATVDAGSATFCAAACYVYWR